MVMNLFAHLVPLMFLGLITAILATVAREETGKNSFMLWTGAVWAQYLFWGILFGAIK